MYKVLAINPGSTSTKLAVYKNDQEEFSLSLDHSAEELAVYENVMDQYDMRKRAVLDALKNQGIDPADLSIIVGRGGPVAPLQSGAYLVDDVLAHKLRHDPLVFHASLLGGLIAYEMAKELGIDALIYDAVSTDELSDIARLSGLKELPRRSLVHTLNMRASAIKYAQSQGKRHDELNLIVAHLGGGLTVSLQSGGKMIDVVTDDEGSFSPERAGILPAGALVDFCYENDKASVSKKLRGEGGLMSYLSTVDAREVEKMIGDGDQEALLVYQALAYQVAKSIGELATVVEGKIDGIILTGGMAYSEMLTSWIKDRVSFIGDVIIVAGENELESLALGGLRVLRSEEKVNRYSE